MTEGDVPALEIINNLENEAEDTPDKSVANDDAPSLQEVIRENATEEDQPNTSQLTLRKILGGDILNTKQVKSQVWLILLITVFIVIYVGNRYSCQKAQIEIAKLEQQLQDIQKKALSMSSELTELSRETNVLKQLKANNDTTLKALEQPPYYIKVK